MRNDVKNSHHGLVQNAVKTIHSENPELIIDINTGIA
jgi:hypothetical protein